MTALSAETARLQGQLTAHKVFCAHQTRLIQALMLALPASARSRTREEIQAKLGEMREEYRLIPLRQTPAELADLVTAEFLESFTHLAQELTNALSDSPEA